MKTESGPHFIRWTTLLFAIALRYLPVFAESLNEKPTIFTYRSPESQIDKRYNYDRELLQLALEKTKDKFGPFRLVGSAEMNTARAMSELQKDTYPNFFVTLNYQDSFAKLGLTYVRFPVELGLIGWRTCFTNPATSEKLKSIHSFEQLKQFKYGQGMAWTDVQILRANGFDVVEVGRYENLFRMVAKERFDLFCRGTNEVLKEWEDHKDIPNLVYDKSIAIFYPLPRVYYTNKNNEKARARIQEGLNIAYHDGSLLMIWKRTHQKSVDFAALAHRKTFCLENPYLKNIDFDYKRYKVGSFGFSCPPNAQKF